MQNIESENLREEEEEELDSVKIGDQGSEVEIQNHESEADIRNQPELGLKTEESKAETEQIEEEVAEKESEKKVES